MTTLATIWLAAGAAVAAAQAAPTKAHTKPDLDSSRLGLIGHSEGGLIAPMVAAKDPTLRAIVLLAAPSQRGRQILDPVETARTVKTPVLILNGAKDQQVTPDQATALEAVFKAADNSDVTIHIVPNTDHEFMYDTVVDPAGYAKLKPHRMQMAVVGTVVDWLVKHLR